MLTILLSSIVGYILGAASLATLALAATRRTPLSPYRPKHPRSSIGRD